MLPTEQGDRDVRRLLAARSTRQQRNCPRGGSGADPIRCTEMATAASATSALHEAVAPMTEEVKQRWDMTEQ